MSETLTKWMLPGAPILATGIAIVAYRSGLPVEAAVCAWVASLCALWWIFECLHIAVVGLVPLVVFPAAGVLSEADIARSYGHPMILLLMGGFFLSAAMENVGAHRRVALTMVQLVGGGSGRRLVLAFMLATGGLSMWISNTAAALMMVPIALAVLKQASDASLRAPLLLGIAYSASIGGMSTPIGTPPNVMFMGQIEQLFGIRYGFGSWMLVALPIVAVLLPAVWWWITRGLTAGERLHVPHPGPWRPSERRVLGALVVTALAWIFRAGPGGGWSAWIPTVVDGQSLIGDTTIAIAAAMFMFLCPAGDSPERQSEQAGAGGSGAGHPGSGAGADRDEDPLSTAAPAAGAALLASGTAISPRLLSWSAAAKIHWGILLMFGGGLALARGFEATGLSAAIGQQLTVFSGAPPLLVILAVCLLVTFMTEITSSTATATLMLPILGGLAVATDMPPESVMIAGTISASCAFMLPVATAPNVIVFAAGGIKTAEMARTGLALNLFAAVLIAVVCWLLLAR